ncbi:bactofilin family protein [Morganella morganii]|uniref:bactofilin family protein n=1 Tax=Morganella morganii TaxID=582 RepID=UPI001C460AB9|nr:polymer-forming cytoskeletal protein [Morganella morganii]QXO64453.1 polymer-forming cytoskeletal protein [Morganella morganii]
MFGKKKQSDVPEAEPVAAPSSKNREERDEEDRKTAELNAQANEISQLLSTRGEEKQRPLASLESRQPTVISKETRLTGDLEISGNLQIWGKIKGQIKARSGTVSIMQSGVVEGDIIAETLLIDGVLSGTCTAEQAEILEHGELNGICRASAFSIRKGGTFIGQSEPYVPAGKATATATAAAQAPQSRPESNKPAAVTEPKPAEKTGAAEKAQESAPKSSPSQNGNGKSKEPEKVPSVFKRV